MAKFDAIVHSSHLLDDHGLGWGPYLLRKSIGDIARYVEDPLLWVYLNDKQVWKSIELLEPLISVNDTIKIFDSANPNLSYEEIDEFKNETVCVNLYGPCGDYYADMNRFEIYQRICSGEWMFVDGQMIDPSMLFDLVFTQNTMNVIRPPSFFGGGGPTIDVRLLDRAPIILQPSSFDRLERWLEEYGLNIRKDFEIIVNGVPLFLNEILTEDGKCWNKLLHCLNLSIVINQNGRFD